MGKNARTTQDRLTRFQAEFDALKAQINGLGYVMQGSVVKRTKQCGNPKCLCHTNKDHEHGPYYQWTAKVKGKTVTKLLSPAEAAARKEFIRNGRQLKKLLARLYSLSEKVAECRAALDAGK